MTAPNRNTLWARALIDELVAAGVDAVVASPGSRSTPLTVAAARTDDLRVFSQLDERSAAYFALGARAPNREGDAADLHLRHRRRQLPSGRDGSERGPRPSRCSRSQPTARRSSATRARTRPPIRRSCTVTPSGFIRICRSPPPTTARSARSGPPSPAPSGPPRARIPGRSTSTFPLKAAGADPGPRRRARRPRSSRRTRSRRPLRRRDARVARAGRRRTPAARQRAYDDRPRADRRRPRGPAGARRRGRHGAVARDGVPDPRRPALRRPVRRPHPCRARDRRLRRVPLGGSRWGGGRRRCV